jgi:hypothetical protein
VDKANGVTLESQLAFTPGMRIRADVQGFGQYQDDALAKLTQTLESRGFIIDPSADLCVRFTAGRGTTGQQIGVTKGWSPLSRPERTFAQQRITCLLTIIAPGGKELWTHQRLALMRSSGFVSEEDPEGQLRAEMESSFQNLISSDEFIEQGLPTQLLGHLEDIVAGSSSLQYGREGPPPSQEPESS